MKKVLQRIDEVITKSAEYQDEIEKRLNLKINDKRSSVFAHIHNNFIIMKELFGFYNNCWEKYMISNPLQTPMFQKENAERILLVEKVIFYEIMGTIEFMLKEHSPTSVLNDCQDKRSHIKISCIMEKLHNKNLIEYNDYKIWKCLMILRNTLIHNGAYAEENTICTAPSFIITFKKEQMCQANLLDFINYIDWILDQTKNLIIKIHNKKI